MMLPEVKRIGANIGLFMKENKVTVRQAASRSGFSISTISELTNGNDKKLSYYFILADSIGMPIELMLETSVSELESNILTELKQLTALQKETLLAFIRTINLK